VWSVPTGLVTRSARRRRGRGAVMVAWVRSGSRRIGRLALEHRGFTLVLGAAAAVRLAVAISYAPAVIRLDSYVYLDLAQNGTPVGADAARPSGYPLLLRILSLDNHTLASVTVLQHLAGLAVGTVVYALLLRLRVRRWLALLVATLVLLDGYAIALEQFILPEALFTLALLASLVFAIRGRGSPPALAASGALLAAAIGMRLVAFYAVPVWAVYLVWTNRRPTSLAAPVAGLALPLLVYSSVYAVQTGHFGMSVADGWFLYGRVAQIADCRGVDLDPRVRSLCEPNPGHGKTAEYYIWGGRNSPAARMFGPIADPASDAQARSNRLLKKFALSIITARPGRYAELVASDFSRFFQPGVMSPGVRSDELLLLPGRERLMRRYEDGLHTPRWLLGPLGVAALAALLLAAFPSRFPIPHRGEIFLLMGSALAMLLGAAATNGFIVRYLVPTVPLILSAGALAVNDLLALRTRTRMRPDLKGGRSRAPVPTKARKVLPAKR
jgi:Dolichyl-phosphate-mannose-protein mannosyltransferase